MKFFIQFYNYIENKILTMLLGQSVEERFQYELSIVWSQCLICLLYLGIVFPIVQEPFPAKITLFFLVLDVLCILAYRLKKIIDYIAVSFCFMNWLVITVLTYYSGGIRSSVFNWLIAPLVVSIMLTRYRQIRLLSTAVILSVVFFIMADIFAIPVGNKMAFLNTKYSFYISYFNIFLYVYVVLRAYEKMLKKTAEQRKQLLRALGHDVKNPIAIIVMTTQLIQTKFGKEPADRTLEKLARIERAGDKAIETLDRLKKI